MIIDDEPLARDVLQSYVTDTPNLTLSAIAKNALEAIELLEKHEVDVLFLDINMPKLSGLSFYKSLDTKPLVVFTTAYSEHAVEGFEVDAIDYLLKPFSFERFLKAVHKVRQKLSSQTTEDFIMLKADKKTYKVSFEEILYFESIGDYVKAHLQDKTLIIADTLRKLEEVLPERQFMRVHKSYLIATTHIEYLEGNQIKLKETKIPIGQSYRDKINALKK
jgi:DNA-binding LytR/AlgR family response regulator